MGDEAPQQLTTEIIKKILKQKRKDFLKENDYQRAISDPKNMDEIDALNNRLETLKASMKESLKTNLHSSMFLVADTALKKFDVEVDHSSENYKMLSRELLRLSIDLIENAIERNNGDYTNAPGLLEEALEEKSIKAEKIVETNEVTEDTQPVLLTQIVKEYLDEQSHTVTEKSLVEYKSALNLFAEIVGDIPADQINHSELRTYKNILQKLPPNKNKIRKFRSLTIEQIIELKLKKTLSIQTINNNIVKVAQMLDWAKRHGYVPENYAQGSHTESTIYRGRNLISKLRLYTISFLQLKISNNSDSKSFKIGELFTISLFIP